MNKFSFKNIKIVGWNAILISIVLSIRLFTDNNWEAGISWLLLSIVLVAFNGTVISYDK